MKGPYLHPTQPSPTNKPGAQQTQVYGPAGADQSPIASIAINHGYPLPMLPAGWKDIGNHSSAPPRSLGARETRASQTTAWNCPEGHGIKSCLSAIIIHSGGSGFRKVLQPPSLAQPSSEQGWSQFPTFPPRGTRKLIPEICGTAENISFVHLTKTYV